MKYLIGDVSTKQIEYLLSEHLVAYFTVRMYVHQYTEEHSLIEGGIYGYRMDYIGSSWTYLGPLNDFLIPRIHKMTHPSGGSFINAFANMITSTPRSTM